MMKLWCRRCVLPQFPVLVCIHTDICPPLKQGEGDALVGACCFMYCWDNKIWSRKSNCRNRFMCLKAYQATLENRHSGNSFVFHHDNLKVNSRNTVFTLQSNPPRMWACIYVTGQSSALLDDVMLHCRKSWTSQLFCRMTMHRFGRPSLDAATAASAHFPHSVCLWRTVLFHAEGKSV